ncbi:hypothetical protein G5I_14616 [Acromyrmex echinatior]|uniref:Uncharacterized protein n=1 Tax=Acromyrmex echinatior TaxID=103372 RepID=F4X8D7_ACREC|nr:hypothetical protein G5I_14616 [Acromyrmex echinatior]
MDDRKGATTLVALTHIKEKRCFIGAIKHGVAAYGRGSRSRKGTITDQTEWSQGNDIVGPGRHDQEAHYAPKWVKTWKSTTVVLVKVIFRADDLVDLLYFREILPSRLRRRYSGPSAECAGHMVGHRAFLYFYASAMSIHFLIPSRGSGAFRFTDTPIGIPFLFTACRRATKSTALARCVRSSRDNKSRCSGSTMSRNSLRALLLSSFSLFLQESDVGGVVHFADLPAPPAEFDVRDNIEAKGDLPSPEWILHLGPSPETAGGRFRKHGRTDKILGLHPLASQLFVEPKRPATQTFAQTVQAAIFFPPGNYGRSSVTLDGSGWRDPRLPRWKFSRKKMTASRLSMSDKGGVR